MELRHLDAFVAVAEELHFGRAATRLGMAQPPLSRQVQQLEARLGVRLLERTKRRVSLTDPGRAFLEEARALLSLGDQAMRVARQAEQGQVGRLRLGHVDSATYEVLPRVLREFHHRYPEVRLVVEEATTISLSRAVAAGELDAALLGAPVRHLHLRSALVLEEPLVVALPEAHQLARDERLWLSALGNDPFVMLRRDRDPTVHDEIRELCRRGGIIPQVCQEAYPVSSVVVLVAAGIGLSLLPGYAADHFRTPGVAYRPLEEPSPSLGLAVAWRDDNDSVPLQRFRELLLEHRRQDGAAQRR